jgi:hypothetical protein
MVRRREQASQVSPSKVTNETQERKNMKNPERLHSA